MTIRVLLQRKTDPAHAEGTGKEGAEAGTAAISPVTAATSPGQTAVLKSQVIKPGTRTGRRRGSKSEAASLTAIAGPVPMAAPSWDKAAAPSEKMSPPFLLQSRAPRAELGRCTLRSDFKQTGAGCC